jgi:hypothetical protein
MQVSDPKEILKKAVKENLVGPLERKEEMASNLAFQNPEKEPRKGQDSGNQNRGKPSQDLKEKKDQDLNHDLRKKMVVGISSRDFPVKEKEEKEDRQPDSRKTDQKVADQDSRKSKKKGRQGLARTIEMTDDLEENVNLEKRNPGTKNIKVVHPEVKAGSQEAKEKNSTKLPD